MDFQRLNRRELQALCKLNKIPANITNVAMIDALNSLEIVVGIEDLMKSSETTQSSSVESPVKTEILSPRITRTGYRTSTRQKPVRHEAESVQTVTRTTRRGVTRQIAGEVEDAKTATVTRKVNLNEEGMYGRTYSTRRSARLTEVKVAEPSSVEKESNKLEKIDSSSTKGFEEMLEEGSDCFNAVSEDPSLSVGIEKNTSEILEPEKEKTSSVDTDMGIEDNMMAIDDKNEKIVDAIASESEDSKLETVGKIRSHEDMDLVRVVAAEMVNDNTNLSRTFEQEQVCVFEDMKTAAVTECIDLENNVENPNELEKTYSSLAKEAMVNNVEKGNSAAQDENQEFPVLCPIEDVDIEFANEEMSKESGDESVMNISGDKENIDQNKLEQLTKDVGMKTKKDNDQLKEISLRQLTKMLKNKLQITSSVNTEEEANITANTVK